MGLLSLGTPLDWHESKKLNNHVRANGIAQLINMFKQHHGRNNDTFLWGDEVEYMLVDIDQRAKTARLSIDHDYILDDLNDPHKSLAKSTDNNVLFHPEYGRFMLEATPARPYDGTCIQDYVYVEENMKKRRQVSESELPPHIKPLTLTTFPRMGCPNFTSPPAKPIGPASQSLFLPDEIINRHVRFPTLTANIRKRRGSKVAINLPLYPDLNTKLLDDSIKHRDLFASDSEPFIGASKPGHVYMDSMGFGMGSSCLQITMQAKNIDESRYLYDTLAPITPVMLGLSAAAPIFKGFLVNQDVRWNVICGAVDDRTFIERGVEPYSNYHLFGGLDVDNNQSLTLEESNHLINEFGDTSLKTKDGKPIQRVPKSRYDSIDSYLSDESYTTGYFRAEYNDIKPPINLKVYQSLMEETGLFDEGLSRHFAHLFIRDPLVLFSERKDQNNELENDHFENLQSTNWQTLRFKPPALYPEGTDLSQKPGWRVEFRPMDIQLTDFENAAYSNFISLLSRAILKFKPNLYVPISKIELNMKLAYEVDAATDQKFWFKSFEQWNLNNLEFIGYDLSWFDRYLNKGNDELGQGEVYVNGYSMNGALKNDNTNDAFKFNTARRRTLETINDVDDDGLILRYTSNEIINGTDKFPGLIRLIVKLIATELIPSQQQHCESLDLAADLTRLKHYLLLISQRASGKIPTTAHFLRASVLAHRDYRKDSKVSDAINYDLITQATSITDLHDRELLVKFFGEEIADFLSVE